MTDVERYLAALAKVNEITDRADSYVNWLRHTMVANFTKARDDIADAYDDGVKAARYIDSSDDGKYSKYIADGEEVVSTCANSMEELARRCRAALLDANGALKPVTEDAAQSVIDNFSEGLTDLAKAAKDKAKQLGNSIEWILYGAIAVAVVIGGVYAYTLYRKAKR